MLTGGGKFKTISPKSLSPKYDFNLTPLSTGFIKSGLMKYIKQSYFTLNQFHHKPSKYPFFLYGYLKSGHASDMTSGYISSFLEFSGFLFKVKPDCLLIY